MIKAFLSVEKLLTLCKYITATQGSENIHGSSQRVFCSGVNEFQRFLVVCVFEDIDSDNRAKDLLDHGDRLGVFAKNDSGLDKEALGVVTDTSSQNFATCIFSFLNIPHNLVI